MMVLGWLVVVGGLATLVAVAVALEYQCLKAERKNIA